MAICPVRMIICPGDIKESLALAASMDAALEHSLYVREPVSMALADLNRMRHHIEYNSKL